MLAILAKLLAVLAKPLKPKDLWLYGGFILFAEILSSVHFSSFKGTKKWIADFMSFIFRLLDAL